MLCSLSLKDFVIVESLSLDVSSGFTVMTGETGAGKSILIDAIQLLLGARADAGVVREGCERADVSAEFSTVPGVDEWLEENELSSEGLLLIRRTVDAHGRSRAWVNGISVAASQLRDLGERLIDVHGQHAHQSLMKPHHQLSLLDDFIGNAKLLDEVARAYESWSEALRKLEEATVNSAQTAEKAERLQWMLDDLELLSPKKGEWEELNSLHTKLAHGAAISEGLSAAAGILSQVDSSASDQISSALGRISNLARYDEKLHEIADSLSSALDLVEECSHDIEKYLDRNDFDASRFEEVDRRVGQYFDLSRKFRTEPEALFDLMERTKSALADLQKTKDVAVLQRDEKAKRGLYDEAAFQLTQSRRSGARRLSKLVTEQMQELAMKGSVFEIAFQKSAPGIHGVEKCEFLVAGHAGVAPRSLIKVASGGELARISLAIAVITASIAPVPTLIFDEVDSGIGGATAEVVGRLLAKLGQERQVLCVTHLPQVAACGDNHWRVEKEQIDGRTTSRLRRLDEAERVEEIARMLSGISILKATRELAKKMLSLK